MVALVTALCFLAYFLGYSIYDGIVVFDKVDENTKGLAASGRLTYGDMVKVPGTVMSPNATSSKPVAVSRKSPGCGSDTPGPV